MTVTERYARPEISKEIKAVDKRTGGLAADLQTLLRSIPGIGVTTAALLVAYVGDIRRFDVREKPVAYVGIDPSFENRDSSHDQTVFIWVHMLPEVTSRVSTISNKTCSERTAT